MHFFSTNSQSSGQPKNYQTLFFPTLHPLSMVVFATAAVLAFVLLHNSRFNFHCYTQREAMPTQKSAWKCAATSRDFLCERLQSTFTLVNQLHWITQKKRQVHSALHILMIKLLKELSSLELISSTWYLLSQIHMKCWIWTTEKCYSFTVPAAKSHSVSRFRH